MRAFVSALTCVFALFITCVSRSQRPVDLTIAEAVAKAKAAGLTSISMGAPGGMPRAVPSYDKEMVRDHGYALRVRALQILCEPYADKLGITTWYRFEVLEDLSRNPVPLVADSQAPDREIPRALLPLSGRQIAVRARGGQFTVDGVLVTYGNPQPLFTPGKEYLVIVEVASSTNQVFAMPTEGELAFSVADDGDTLIPLKAMHNAASAQGEIQRRFHNSLRALAEGTRRIQ